MSRRQPNSIEAGLDRAIGELGTERIAQFIGKSESMVRAYANPDDDEHNIQAREAALIDAEFSALGIGTPMADAIREASARDDNRVSNEVRAIYDNPVTTPVIEPIAGKTVLITDDTILQAVSAALDKRAREAANFKKWKWRAATACGVNIRTFEKWLYGETVPEAHDLMNLCEHFGPEFMNETAALGSYVFDLKDNQTPRLQPEEKEEPVIKDSETIPRDAGAESERPDPYRTGMQGRPTVSRLVKAEFERRIGQGLVVPKLAAEARALCAWVGENYPDGPSMTARTIENAIRSQYRGLRKNPTK